MRRSSMRNSRRTAGGRAGGRARERSRKGGRAGRGWKLASLCCRWCGAIFLHVIVPGSLVVCHSNATPLHSTLKSSLHDFDRDEIDGKGLSDVADGLAGATRAETSDIARSRIFQTQWVTGVSWLVYNIFSRSR